MSKKEDKRNSTVDIVPVFSVLAEPQAGHGAVGIKRDGSFIMQLRVFPTDFDMRDPGDQNGILQSWRDMCDSLDDPDFPIQIQCHNTKLDPDVYFRQFETQLQNPNTTPLKRRLIEDHKDNFQKQIVHNGMVQKAFYIVIPYKAPHKPVGDNVSDNFPFGQLFKALGQRAERTAVREPDPRDLEVARMELDVRVSQIQFYLERMGCQSYRVDEAEMRRVYFEHFHPGLAERQRGADLSRGRFMPSVSEDNTHRATRRDLPSGGSSDGPPTIF